MINDRIQKIVDDLFGGNVSAFCRATNTKQPTMNTILGERKSRPSYEVLSAIVNAKALNISSEWLISGVGEMIKGTSSNVIEADPNYMDVELVSKYAYAGYLCGYGDQEYLLALPRIKVPVDHEAKGNYKAFEVKGDSMCDNSIDSYLDGDIILCREVHRHLWLPKLRINTDDFVIVHRDGILLKRIIEQNNETGSITIHSLNPDKSAYPDEKLLLNDCLQIFNVIKIVDRKKRR